MTSEERRGLLPKKEEDEDDSSTESSQVVFNGGGQSGSFALTNPDPHYYSRGPLHVPLLVQLSISLGLFKYVPKPIFFKVLVYILTFIGYATYHMSRKPFSVVKVVLNPPNDSSNGWPPFNTDDGKTLLGGVDNAWGFSYAFAMFFSGIIADRVNLRYFLTMGMLGSAIATMLLGVPYYAGIHLYAYFILVQIFGGVMQSTGWPSVVSIMSHWFGKQRYQLFIFSWRLWALY
ncbi:Putative glycerol-3-phosphate transporter 5 [Geodia barretti]|uniref:Glycerol-3-phosphate transporter 5 n=1 Tax=Geodia barretti TaxID=519541 RepID=A0AA35SEJ4_GEOBA|nr:Putative glycerol-3-phosphate transporter 5 [Geodia barretti]